MIETRHLQHLIALAEHRNYSRAAEALGLTQPALSRSIQNLEAALGAVLFDRGQGPVMPTAVGALVLERARTWALDLRELERDVRLAQGAELGTLRIGAGPFAGSALAGPVVGRLSRLYPRLQVDVLIAPWKELPERLLARDIDLMLADLSEVQAQEAIELTALQPHPSVTVVRAGHPLAGLPAPSLEQLRAYPWAGPQVPQEVAERMARLLPAARAGQPMQPLALRCDSSTVLKDILRHCDALSLMCVFMVAEELRRGQLVAIPGLPLRTVGRFGVARLRGRTLSAPEQVFIEQLQAFDGELLQEEEALLARHAPGAGFSASPRRRSRRSATAGTPASSPARGAAPRRAARNSGSR
ncbi:MAG: LysR family transcriptional regulator [Rhodocyclaceae bacterium]|nr:LysR family transcriptional regulator [Rhodocyclaceae bacterium]